jgi:hypothetical protein
MDLPDYVPADPPMLPAVIALFAFIVTLALLLQAVVLIEGRHLKRAELTLVKGAIALVVCATFTMLTLKGWR